MRTRIIIALLLSLALVAAQACDSGSTSQRSAGGEGGSGSGSGEGGDGSGSGGDGQTGESPPPSDGGDVPAESASFVAISDFGCGNDAQMAVANAMKNYCMENRCDFAITAGDNFQCNDDFDSKDPGDWERVFHNYYDELGLVFYAALGNHDHYGDDDQFQAQIDYVADNWYMPDEQYTFSKPDNQAPPFVDFFVIDSEYGHYETPVMIWLNQALDNSEATWKLLVMHRPIYNNGNHGDGDDDYREALIPVICGSVDFAISGHSHTFSHLRSDEDGCMIDQLILAPGGANHRLDSLNLDDQRVVTSNGVLGTGGFNGFGWFNVTREQITFRLIRVQVDEDEDDFETGVYYEAAWEK